MSEEVREIIYTATNLIFIAAVLFIAMLFFDLRSDYGDVITERVITERKVLESNRYNGFDSRVVTGYEVMNAITAYSGEVPVYVTGAYNHVTGEIVLDRLYDSQNRIDNPDWFKISTNADPIRDREGLQALYRKEMLYFAVLTYDSDMPESLIADMDIGSPAKRQGTSMTLKVINGASIPRITSDTVPLKVEWLGRLHTAARDSDYHGSTVSGIVFICVDASSITDTTTRNMVSIY